MKIGQALEEEQIKKEEEIVTDFANKDLNSEFRLKEDSRSLILTIIILAGVFGLLLGGFKLYGNLTTAGIVTLEDLHQNNLNGELDKEIGYVYNGYSFVKIDGLWWTETKVGERLVKIPLHFGPKELEEISTKGSLTEDFYYGEEIYVAINPTINYDKYYTLALMELNNNVLQGINRQVVSACTEHDPICEEREILNCKNTKGKPVIELVIDENPGIKLSGTCIKITGKDFDLVKSVNRLLYQWYGIMS